MLALVVGCGPDKPAEYSPAARAEANPVETSLPPAPVRPAATAARVEEDPPDPALADAPAKPLGRDEIRILVKSLPLRIDAIRFEAIDKFLLLYAPFTANKALLRETRESLRAAQNCLKVPMSAISLGMSLSQLAGLLKDPPGRFVFPVLGALSNSVSRTRDVILDFYEQVRDQAPEAEKNAILGQIGRNPDDGGIAGRNLDSLETTRTSGTVQ
jgi:hypothetical protein